MGDLFFAVLMVGFGFFIGYIAAEDRVRVPIESPMKLECNKIGSDLKEYRKHTFTCNNGATFDRADRVRI